ncbi:cation:proton antiporter (plasmid) [Halobellus limi]|uniref:Cation:proton antiporter n=1 Tax=Halobellus limi TaxID=699433 RepID=A0A4D6H895_9EURY|nr:cation:proton antiporter [Halobellus limi]
MRRVRDDRRNAFFFDIGYEHLDLTELLSVGSAAISIALFGMIIPAGTGLVLGLAFDYSVAESAFLALALSVTSIAVTARTLLDLHQLDSRVGRRVVGAAIVDDVVGLLAFALLLLAVSGDGTIEAVATLGQVIGFFALAVIARFTVIQQLSSLLARSRQIEADILALFSVIFLVSFSAEAVGLDVTLGALIIGLLVGEDERLSRLEVREGIAGIAYGMFIPLFSQAWEHKSISVS